jgi:hypothetical protein
MKASCLLSTPADVFTNPNQLNFRHQVASLLRPGSQDTPQQPPGRPPLDVGRCLLQVNRRSRLIRGRVPRLAQMRVSVPCWPILASSLHEGSFVNHIAVRLMVLRGDPCHGGLEVGVVC